MSWALATALAGLTATGIYFLHNRPRVLVGFLLVAVAPLLLGSVGGALITSILALSILLAQPLYVVLGGVTLFCFEYLSESPPVDYGIFPEKIYELTDKNVLLAIPFFVVAGAIMSKGGIASALIELAKALTWWVPGGVGIAAIGGCVLFAAISGSSPVTVIAIGGMMYPTLRDHFGDRLSTGLLTSAGSLGIVIPPSIPMIIYAMVVSSQQPVDVGDLFLAGLGPGLLIGGLLAAYVIGYALRRSTAPKQELIRFGKGLLVVAAPLIVGEIVAVTITPWGHALGPLILLGIAISVARKAFVEGFWALMLPVIILGGIYTGFFTPTQAAAVAAVYATVVTIYINRELVWKDMPDLIVDSTVMMGALIVIIVMSFVFNDFLVDEKVPDALVRLIDSLNLGRAGFLVVLNIFLLFVGCFMDIMSAILILAPLVAPIAAAPGIEIDPIHLGLIFIVNLELGYLTPPLGINLFVASTLFRKRIGEVVRSVLPFTAIMLVGILLITYVPAISLGPGRWIASLGGQAEDETQKKVLSIEDLMNQADEEEDEDIDGDSKEHGDTDTDGG